MCKREITRDEVMKILGPERKTDLLTDFTSRFGRPFSAILFLKENGRHGFEFAPRQPRGKAAETDGVEAEAGAEPGAETAVPKKARATPKTKAAPRAKATAAKTPGKKASRKKA